MHRNAVWIAFLLIVATISLWFIVKAGYQLAHYYQLTQQVPVKVESWSVVEESSDKYKIEAQYVFAFQGKDYKGKEAVGEIYPNPWAAQTALNNFSKKDWMIWINPERPSKAVIQKHFPFKTAFSALILLILTIYFFCLGLYVGGNRGRS